MTTESIFDGKTAIIPLADVQHIEKFFLAGELLGYSIIMKHTQWDPDNDTWANNIYLPLPEGDDFLAAWCRYRHEIEKDTLLTISPSA